MHTGRHFLQIPGPTNVPDRVLRAMDRPVINNGAVENPDKIITMRMAPGPK